jgi:hypothetical protein
VPKRACLKSRLRKQREKAKNRTKACQKGIKNETKTKSPFEYVKRRRKTEKVSKSENLQNQ